MKYAQLFIGAGLTLLGAWVGMAFATATDASAVAKWWDLMTAFGTVGAVIAAVGIALWQGYATRQQRVAEATLIMAEAYPRFLALKAACNLARQFFAEMAQVDASPQESEARVDLLRREFIGAALPQASQLRPLGGFHAQRLAAVNAHLDTLVRISNPKTWTTRDSRVDCAQFIVRALDVAIPRLGELGEAGHGYLVQLNQAD